MVVAFVERVFQSDTTTRETDLREKPRVCERRTRRIQVLEREHARGGTDDVDQWDPADAQD